MKLLNVFALLTLSLSLVAQAKPLPGKVGDFALLDHEGRQHQLSYYGDLDAVIILTHAIDDAAVDAAIEKLVTGNSANTVTLMLNAQAGDMRDAIAASASSHDIPILLDEAQLVSRSLGAQRTAEVMIINPATMKMTYRDFIPPIS